MKEYNILKIISIIVIVLQFVCCVSRIFLVIYYNYNIDTNLIFDSITSFMMGISLLLILYLSDIW